MKRETLGHRLKRLREAAEPTAAERGRRLPQRADTPGLFLSELAERTGGRVTRAQIGHLETGHSTNPTLATLEALALALGVAPAYLAGWDASDSNSK